MGTKKTKFGYMLTKIFTLNVAQSIKSNRRKNDIKCYHELEESWSGYINVKVDFR
jgi:hypothetical protein